MNKGNSITRFLLVALITVSTVFNVFSQSVTRTVSWTGAIAQGGCSGSGDVCGGDWQCSSNSWGGWNNGLKTFTDPVPGGNVLTSVSVAVYQEECDPTSVNVLLNGQSLGSFSVFGTSCLCGYGLCTPNIVTQAAPISYNYGASNTLQLVATGGTICVNRAIITLNYQSAAVPGPCPNDNVALAGTPTLDPPCGTFTSIPMGGGTYVNVNVINGASYSFSTCLTSPSFDTKISAYQGNTSTLKFFNDDNGPFCAGQRASATWTSDFTGILRVNVDEPTCTYSTTSATLQYRQNNNVSLTSSTADICAGSTRVLSGIPAGGTFSITSGGGNISGNILTASNTPGTYTLTYTVGQCSESDDIEVVANPTNPTSLTANPNSSVCPGTSVDLTVNGGSLGGGSEWVWYLGNSCGGAVFQNSGNARTITVTPTSTTTYSVRAEGPCGNTICVTRTITVNNASTAPTNAAANPSTAVCPGDPVILTASGGSLGTGGVYRWYSGSCGGAFVSNGNPITVNPTAASTTYYVRAEDNCGNTSCASVTVNTKVESTAPTGINPTANNFCPGTSTTLNVVGGSLGTGGQWVWYSGAACCGLPIASGVSSINVSPTATTTYYVRAQDDCGNTNFASVVITVKEESIPASSITASATQVCGTVSNSITLSVTGGSLGTNANWYWYSDGCGTSLEGTGPSLTISNLNTTTTYFVRAEGECNTTACASQVILVSNGVNLSSSFTNPSCNGASDGTATVTPSNGISPYSYVWSNGSPNDSTATGLSAGSYTVTVYDDAGCSSVQSFNLVDPQVLAITNISSTNVACNGAASGTINVTATGGTPPLRYSVDGGSNYQSSGLFNGLSSGAYNVQVLDTNNCLTIFSGNPVVLSQPSALVLTIDSFQDASCSGANNGEINSSATGGNPPYDFSLNGGPFQPSGNFASLSAGTYTVLVRDASGCTETQTQLIDNQTALTVYEVSTTDASCFGASDGSATFANLNGTNPVNYTINNITFQTNPTFNNLSAGTYTVLASDALGCSNDTTFTIGEPAEISIVLDSVANVGCFGVNSGGIFITASGGTGVLTYAWSDGSFDEDRTGLSAGTYAVTVTDANNCSNSTIVTLTQAPQLFLSLADIDSIDCNGIASGGIDITVNGGTPPYTFNWSNAKTSEDISNLTPGTYGVTVTDNNGCQLSDSWTLTQPTAISVSGVVVDASCSLSTTGSIDASVSGGVAPYSYEWSNGETTQDITNLSGGTYILTVTDAKGCSKSQSFNVADPSALTITDTVTDVSCYGLSDGAASLSVSGGTSPYTYLWTTGATIDAISGVPAGTYGVTVTDDLGCSSFTSVVISQPDSIVLATTVDDINCAGAASGSITLTVSGGSTPYSYLWSNGATTKNVSGLVAGTYVVTVTDDNGCTATISNNVSQVDSMELLANIENVSCNNGSDGRIFTTVKYGFAPYIYSWSNGDVTGDITGLTAGTYTVTMTDFVGCVLVESFTVTEPTLLQSTIVASDVLCNGQSNGNIDLTVTGGTPPYSYLWSNFDSAQDLTGVGVGLYTVVVEDANGCTITNNATIAEPNAISVSDSVNDVTCFGGNDGSIFLTVTGGTAPLTYNWSNGATTEDITGLTVGTYILTITDDNACTAVLSFAVGQPSELLVSSTSSDASCFGVSDGSIDVVVSGGVMPYNYNWSNGATAEDLSGLAAGVYDLTVVDANGCSATLSDTINEPTQIVVTDTIITNVSCFDGFDGAIDITVSGGTMPYDYEWSLGLISQDVNGLYAGTYSITITDANGCELVESYVVDEPQALSASFAGSNNVFCFGDSSGNVLLTVNGGTSPYTYDWSNGATTQNLNNVPVGLYSVVIEDANGCTLTASYSVTQPRLLSVSGAITNVTCFGGSDGEIDLTVSGGVTSYTYDWSTNDVTQDITGLSSGTYTVIVSDANSCSDTTSYVVTQPDSFAVSAQVIDVDCYGNATGGIDVTVTGSNPPYTYEWSNLATTQDIFGLVVGTYTLTITDVDGCEDVSSYTINEPDSLDTDITSVNLACNGTPSGSVDLTVNGGTPPYRYAWSNGATTQDLLAVGAGFYSVTVTDFNGCTKFDSVTVTQPDPLNASANVTNILCNGDSTGAIDLTPFGGITPYSYDWSNGETTQDLTGLPTGLYTVTITDDSSCTVVLTYNVSEPSVLDLTSSQIDVTCYGDNGGQLNVFPNGGTQPYDFNWSNGDTTGFLTRLFAGDYYLTLTDANGCEKLDTFTISQPDSIVTSTVVVDASCNGNFDGSIDLTVSGGVQPYEYLWNGFNFTQDLNGLQAGRYVVIVTDSNGCQAVDSAFVGQPSPLVIDVFVKGAGCGASTGGIIDLTVSGGTPGYSYLWSTSDTTEDLTGLAAGTYTVTVTDSNGCEEEKSVLIPSFPEPVASFTADNACFEQGILFENTSLINSGTMDFFWDYGDGETDSLIESPFHVYAAPDTYVVTLTALSNQGCIGTFTDSVVVYPLPDATISGTGGNPCVVDSVELSVAEGYVSYRWSTGDTVTSIKVLESGTYRITVENIYGCTNVDTIPVFISEVNSVSISEDTTINFGFGAELYANGGDEYVWSPAATVDFPFSSSPIVTPEVSTTYTVVVSDENGCTFSDTVRVNVSNEILLIIPNIITPNGDGFNETWEIKNILNYDICQVSIFNRWGNEVYSQSGYQNDWDGGKLPDGTYYYVIKCDNSDVLYKGAVTILR